MEDTMNKVDALYHGWDEDVVRERKNDQDE
jgi:hypothetical protein